MEHKEQTAVEWLATQIMDNWNDITAGSRNIADFIDQAKQMEKHQQDTFAIDFAEWYENDVLAKGDYEMIAKDKKELLGIFKKTYEQQ